jgi:L-threonylcarbamoyladenylate synthase
MAAEIISIETRAKFALAVRRATELLRAGQVVALPTETVYGLAANAWDENAVRRIFEVKGRPPENPIIVHVAGLPLARRCVADWPAAADKLASAFWPGPLTLVLPRSPEIPSLITAGGPTVGVRWPSHFFMQAVIAACGFPLAAPSANRSNQLSPTTAEHVRKSLGAKIALIIDGGPSQVGIESSVLDLVSKPPRLLRPGMISVDSVRAVVGEVVAEVPQGSEKIERSPGRGSRHYAPQAKLVVRRWQDEEDLVAQVSAFGLPREKVYIVAYHRIPLREKFGRIGVIPADAEAYARALYAELHLCDEKGAQLIVVEEPPPGEAWRAIADRLQRAAQGAH